LRGSHRLIHRLPPIGYSWVRRRILRLNLISIAVNCNAKVHREENVSSYTQYVW
jgi:hypothetical protein